MLQHKCFEVKDFLSADRVIAELTIWLKEVAVEHHRAIIDVTIHGNGRINIQVPCSNSPFDDDRV